MNSLTFKNFLAMIEEDVNQDIATLTLQKQQLLIQKANNDKQVDARIASIDRALFQKEQQKAAEDKKLGNTSTQQTTQPSPQQAGTRTTTPGSAGAQTPGMASQSAIPQR